MSRSIGKGIRASLLGIALALGYGMPVLALAGNGYVADARQYLAQGQYNAAIIQLKNALLDDPSNMEARLLLGEADLRSGDQPGAQKEFERAARLGAPKEQWMPGLAQALIEQGLYTKLLQEAKPDASMKPAARATVLALRGDAHLAQNDSANARKEYQAALALQPANPLARLGEAQLLLKQGKREEAIKALSAVLKQFPNQPDTRLARGEVYRTMGDYNKAIADFTVGIKYAPTNPRGYVGRALCYLTEGKDQKARPDIKALKNRFGNIPIVHYLQALLEFRSKHYGKANDQLQQVLRVLPDSPQTQLLYGMTNYALGNYTIADNYLSRLTSTFSSNLGLRKVLAASRLKLNQPQRAISALKPVLQGTGGKDPEVLALLGSAYMMAGQSDQGAKYLAEAVKLAPKNATLRAQLAAGRIASGNTPAAIPELKEAVQLNGHFMQADVLLVLSYISEKQFEQARTAALSLASRMPGSPIPTNLVGLTYLAQKQLDKAKEKFREALKIDPKFAVAAMNIARADLLAKDLPAARKDFHKVLEIDSKNAEAMLGLAVLAKQQGNQAGEQYWLEQASQAAPGALKPKLLLAEIYVKTQQPLKAINMLSGLSTAQASNPFVLRVKGIAQMQSGDYASARTNFRRLVTKLPNWIEGWFQLGRSQMVTGDEDGALESFSHAVSLDTDHRQPLPWLAKAQVLLQMKHYQQALKLAQEMHKYFPKNASAYEVEGAVYRAEGDVQKSLGALEKAVQVEGTSKRVNLLAYSLGSSGNPSKGTVMVMAWLHKHPKDTVSWTTLGMLYQEMGRTNEAVDAYQKVLSLGAENPVVYNNLAWAYLHQGHMKKAMKYAKQAYNMAPDRPEIADTYGWIQFKDGKREAGLNTLKQAMVASSNNADIMLHVAEAMHALGRDSQARPLLEQVIEHKPTAKQSARAQKLLAELRP